MEGGAAVGPHDVVVAGGGPTGLMLAGELALGGVDVVVVERRADQALEGRRAGGLHSRTLEVLDQRGILDRFLDAGEIMQIQGFGGTTLDIGDFPTRHPYGLALPQSRFEPLLAGWVDELGVPTRRNVDVVGLEQDADDVRVALSDGSALRGRYLVGCDGGRSLVRKAAGIGFPGLAPSTSWIIADVEMDEVPTIGVRPEGGGIGPVDPARAGGPFGVVLREATLDHDRDPTLDDLRRELVRAYGTDFGAHHPTRLSRFTDASRQAAEYRRGRVLLAGDAAHIHPPQGGQGLNVGVQDAVNLGWKLAQVLHHGSADDLLDTYQAERHPVAARVLRNTEAQVALSTGDERHQSLRDLLGDLLALDEPRRRIAGMLTGLDVHYDLGPGHGLLGWRMPDLDLIATDGTTRISTLLHDARPLLIELDRRGSFDLGRWSDRVRWVDATSTRVADRLDLPVVGEVPTPPAVLIRPDGHVAWAGEVADPQLPLSLSTWFGGPSPR